MKKAPQGSKNKGPCPQALKSKPFCDCMECTCEQCPDIPKLLGITTEKSCDFDSKVTKGKGGEKKKSKTQKITVTPSLLGVMNDNRDCACEIMARAVTSHVHANFGWRRHESPPPEDTDKHTDNPE